MREWYCDWILQQDKVNNFALLGRYSAVRKKKEDVQINKNPFGKKPTTCDWGTGNHCTRQAAHERIGGQH